MNGTRLVALVMGVGRTAGIGFEVCRQLAQQGLSVLLSARDLSKAEAAARQLSYQTIAQAADSFAMDSRCPRESILPNRDLALHIEDDRQAHRHGGTAANRTFHHDRAAVLLHNAVGY